MRSQRIRLFAVVITGLFVGACGGDSTPGEPSPQPDVGTPELCDALPSPSGCACTHDELCDTGICLVLSTGMVCAGECLSGCASPLQCIPLTNADGEKKFVCADPTALLCSPCSEDPDCEVRGFEGKNRCLDYGDDGKYCGSSCGAGMACGAGYECSDGQCQATSGQCGCSPLAIGSGAGTACQVTNEFGSCVGERQCTDEGLSDCSATPPAAESCDGADNDCDGQIDELAGEPCDIENEWGTCKGETVCAGQKTECVGTEPASDLCDGLDNNCDGTIDNGYPDTDKDMLTDCVDPDDDNDDVLDEMDNCPTTANKDQSDVDLDTLGDACDPDDDNDGVADAVDCEPLLKHIYPLAPEDCDGFDNDCDGTTDENSCNDDDLCTDDTCSAGGCVFTPNTVPCNDNNPCTSQDACSGGSCLGGTATDCDDENPCTDDSCDPGAGCVHTANTGACDDGSVCTTDDFCANKVCVGGEGILCDVGMPCTIDSCDALLGCQASDAPNGTPCDDGNFCTEDSICQLKECKGKQVDCDDNDMCSIDVCNPQVGCEHYPDVMVTKCHDDNPCTKNESCKSGQCLGTLLDCDDGDSCTLDVCVTGSMGQAQCENTSNPGDCDDGVVCTGNDTCATGQCVGTPLDCDDGDPCTDDLCEENKGCVHWFTNDAGCQGCQTTADCDDGDPITVDVCMPDGSCMNEGQGGSCQQDGDCFDGNPCTPDICLANGTCAASEGSSCCTSDAECDDGNALTLDACNAGQCVFGPTPNACQDAVDCDDSNACTTEYCVATYCLNVPISGCCATDGECDDDDECTTDICGASGQCDHAAVDTWECIAPPCYNDVDCPANPTSPCDIPRCNHDTKKCEFVSLVADGNGGCVPCSPGTENCHYCDPDWHYLTITQECDDGFFCTYAQCDPTLHICVQTMFTTLAGCGPLECSSNHDCDDSDPFVSPKFNDTEKGRCTYDSCDWSADPPVCQFEEVKKADNTIDHCPIACGLDNDCDDGDPCTEDRCDISNQSCTWIVVDCTDDNPCTTDHQCDNGCQFTADLACDVYCENAADCATNDLCMDAQCVGNQCQVTPTKCDDGNACTFDFCEAGSCKTLAVTGCSWNGCSTAADCATTYLQHEGASGQCVQFQCTADGTCSAAPKVCNDYDACTEDVCDPDLGCLYMLDPTCTLGCQSATDCDDDDVHTIDTCDVTTNECQHEYIPKCNKDADCWDTNGCTYEWCGADGLCKTKPVLCTDEMPCTKDLAPCGAWVTDIAGEAAYELNCQPGAGQPAACDPASGCIFLPVIGCNKETEGPCFTDSGEPCVEVLTVVECTTDAECDTQAKCWPGHCKLEGNGKGFCAAGPVHCPYLGDGIQSFCDPKTGQCTSKDKPGWTGCKKHQHCRNVPQDPIGGFNRCEIAYCNLTDPDPKQCFYYERNCNDLNPCTTDVCDPQVGCVFTPIAGCKGCAFTADCNDYDRCTTDNCNTTSGECSNTSIPGCTACTLSTQEYFCDDGDPCTQDMCDETAQPLPNEPGTCFHIPIPPAVDPLCGP